MLPDHRLGMTNARRPVRDYPDSLWQLSLILRDIASNDLPADYVASEQANQNLTQADGAAKQLVPQGSTCSQIERTSDSKLGNESSGNVIV